MAARAKPFEPSVSIDVDRPNRSSEARYPRPMGVWGRLKRLAADRLTAAAMIVTVAVSMVLLAAGPVYSEAVAVGALRKRLADAPATDAAVLIDVVLDSADVAVIDESVTDRIDAAIQDASTRRMIVAEETFELPVQLDEELVDVAQVAYVEEIQEHVTITSGRWTESANEVVVDARAARALAIEIDTSLELRPRVGDGDTHQVRVVGSYSIDDALDPFWSGRERLADGITESRLFRSASLVAPRDAVTALGAHAKAKWVVLPDFANIGLNDVEPMRRRVASLAEAIDDSLAASTVNRSAMSEIAVETLLPGLLRTSDRSLTISRSAVLAVEAQLALLAAYALVLVAGLRVDALGAEAALLRARGASSAQVLGGSLVESAIVVVPAAAIAPRIAALVLRGFDDFGPLASADLAIEPEPVGAAYVAAALAAVVMVVLLAWPAFRSARSAEVEGHRHRRRHASSGVQRAGIDVALLGFAGLAYWQLATLGDDRAAQVRGRFGVDPLLVVAPTLGLIAGSFLALRVAPALAGLAERRVVRSRSIVRALPGWQFARRPERYARSALLLVMAVAIGALGATYEATWLRSQTDQTDHQVGVDARVVPDRQAGSISDLHLLSAHEQLEAVEHSVPVLSGPASLPSTELDGRTIALDSSTALAIALPGEPLGPLAEGLATLAERRPTMPSFALPGRPHRITVGVTFFEREAIVADEVLPRVFAGSATIVFQDGRGLLHRRDLGLVRADGSRTDLDVELAAVVGADRVIEPAYPLSIVDIEIRYTAPLPPSRIIDMLIGSIALTDAAGDVSTIDPGSANWRLRASPVSAVDQLPAIEGSADRPAEGFGATLQTGSAEFVSVPVVVHLRPSGSEVPALVPAIVTSSWLASSDRSVGDSLAVSLLQVENTRIEIVGVVDSVPTIDPAREEVIVVDLPTLQVVRNGQGLSLRDVTEHWIDLAPGGDVEAALTAPPIGALDVTARSSRLAEMTSDPPALSAIGALTLGFLASAMFAFVGFVVTVVVSARERRAEFALLRALGLTGRQLGRWMTIEQLVLIAVGAAFGTVIGVGLSALILPAVSLTQDGGAVFPEVAVSYPWRTILAFQAVVAIAFVCGLVVITSLVRRFGVGAALRGGDEL